jgi:hypothetical protein
MNRSLWPEGVEIHQADLVRETQDTINSIAVRHASATTMGVLSGLSVSPASGNPNLLFISSGAGYAPNGELVVVTTDQNNISLADSTVDAVNYILAIYTEIYGDPQAHEDLGTTLPTSAVGSFRIAVLTSAQWSALPISDPNLNNNARDRSVLLAIVTGTGGALTQANIQTPTPYPTVLYISQPTSISGVRINSVSPGTQTGTGVLTYTIASGVRRLQWQAPNDYAGGTPSGNITTDTTLVLTSASSNPVYSIVVSVAQVDLPVDPATITNSITISDIYAQMVPRLSGVDSSHRHMLGSGIATTTNPHALTLEDIGADINGVLQQHQLTMHANGILDPLEFGQAKESLRTTIVSASGQDDVARIAPLDSITDLNNAVYVNGLRLTGIGEQFVSFDDVRPNYYELYGIYLQPNGTVYKKSRAIFNPPPNTGEVGPPPTGDIFSGNVQIVNISDFSHIFDSDLSTGIMVRDNAGTKEMALVVPVGWHTFWVPLNNTNPSTGILRLPYPISATNESPPPRGSYNYIEVWINQPWIQVAPAGTVPLYIYARPVQETSYLLSYVLSQGRPVQPSGPATVMLGWGLRGNLSTLRTYHVADKRLFGTLAGNDINEQSIAFTKIKDLSSALVVDGLGYVPYSDANLAPFAVNVPGGGPRPFGGIYPPADSTNSHVVYADYAGSASSTLNVLWNAITGRPSALAGMTNGNTFNEYVTFAKSVTMNEVLELTYDNSVRWGGNQRIVGDSNGTIIMNAAGGVVFNGPVSGSGSAVFTGYGQFNGGLHSGGDLTMNNHRIAMVANPSAPQDAVNLQYLNGATRTWTQVTALTGWQANQVYCTISAGIVYIRGDISCSINRGASDMSMQLPAGYYPSNNICTSVEVRYTGLRYIGRATISIDGYIHLQYLQYYPSAPGPALSGQVFYLDNISYPTWLY